MASGAEFFIRRISIQADEAARQWNKTKDPSFKDQWYKLVRQIPKPKQEVGYRINDKKLSKNKY